MKLFDTLRAWGSRLIFRPVEAEASKQNTEIRNYENRDTGPAINNNRGLVMPERDKARVETRQRPKVIRRRRKVVKPAAEAEVRAALEAAEAKRKAGSKANRDKSTVVQNFTDENMHNLPDSPVACQPVRVAFLPCPKLPRRKMPRITPRRPSLR